MSGSNNSSTAGNSGVVSFSQIPPNLRIPLTWVEFDNSQAGMSLPVQRVLLIGQSINAQPVAPQFVPSPAAARNLFGRGSHLARMMDVYDPVDPLGEVWACPVGVTGGTAATQTLTITGPATAAGTFPLYVAGQSVPVGVSSGDTAAAIATNIAAAITAGPDLPVTAAAASGVVTLTAKQAGSLGNQIDVRIAYYGLKNNESLPAGVGATIAVGTAGAGAPDLSGLAAALGDQPFDFIVFPFSDAASLATMSAIMSFQSGRWSYASQTFGHVFSAQIGTATALLAAGGALNDPHLTMIGLPNTPTPPWEAAAVWVAASSPSLKADPARPLQTLSLPGVLAPALPARLTRANQQALLSAGIALPAWAQDGSASILRSVTTYQTNKYGQSDISYLDCETLYTLAAITRQLTAALQTKFGRSKLADNGTRFGPGQPIVTPNSAKAELIAQYRAMERAGLVENSDAMSAATICQRNANDPSRLDILWAPYLVSGLRIIAVLNQFRLQPAL